MAIGRFAAALIVVGAAVIGTAVGAETIPGPAAVVRAIDGDTLDVRARVWVGNDITALVRRREGQIGNANNHQAFAIKSCQQRVNRSLSPT